MMLLPPRNREGPSMGPKTSTSWKTTQAFIFFFRKKREKAKERKKRGGEVRKDAKKSKNCETIKGMEKQVKY